MTVKRMRPVMSDFVKASGEDYKDMRRFEVKDDENNGQIVSKHVKHWTNLKLLLEQDIFKEHN